MPPFAHTITTEAELRELIPKAPPNRLSHAKVLDHLDGHARAWIDHSPLVLVGTADAQGRCDVSPRGGPAGWVQVLDDHRLALPDAPGNRRADSWHNVLENPNAGLLFLVPGRRETLRINGVAHLTTDPELLRGIPGEPKLALGIEVREAYLHCAKAFMRSHAWEPETWPAPDALASCAQILRDHTARNGRDIALPEAEELIEDSIRTRMW